MFGYTFKKVLNNKLFLFWSLIFPIALMSLFHVAFGGLYDVENNIDPIDVAVIYDADNEFSRFYENVLDELSSGDAPLLNVIEGEENQLRQKVEGSQISGVFIVKDDTIDVAMCPKYSSTDAMILNAVANYYIREYGLIADEIARGDFDAVGTIVEGLSQEVGYISEEQGVFAEKTDPYNWYYYSTIVMGILFQAMAGINMVSELQADIADTGERKVAMRTSVSPVPKSRLIVSAFSSRLFISVVISSFSILCMNKVFGIPVGSRLPQLLLFILASNMFAISLGEMFGLFFKGNMSARGNKGTALIMISVFLSGEMIATLPGTFERYAPYVNDLNPATILNFSMYRLVYYEDLRSFYIEMGKILIMTAVFLVISTIRLRRQKYASL